MKPLERDYSTATVQELFSRVAWVYDVWGRLTEEKAVRTALELAAVRDGERVLEVAVGTGQLFERLVRELNPDGENVGIDLSPAMVRRARRRLGDVDASRYTLAQGDALSLPYPDGAFDLVLNNYMLDLFPEHLFDPALRELARVLAPAGRLVITSMAFGHRWYHRIWYHLSRWFPRLLTDCRPILLEEPLRRAGLEPTRTAAVSQNTFPSQVIRAQPLSGSRSRSAGTAAR